MSKSRTLQPFINGEYLQLASTKTKVVSKPKHILINPSNARPHTYQYQTTSSTQIQKALECAKHAQRAWASTSPSHRATILRNAAHIMSKNVDLLSEMETLDTGRVIRETKYDIEEGVECLQYYAGVANSIGGNTYNLPGSMGTNLAYTLREPIGVTVGIGAWNYRKLLHRHQVGNLSFYLTFMLFIFSIP